MSISVRGRRRIARLSIAACFLCLVAVVVVPGLRRHALAGGWILCATAVVGILASLAYLRSSGGRS